MKVREFRIDYIDRVSQLETIEWIPHAQDKNEAAILFRQQFGDHKIQSITGHWANIEEAAE